jgi:hypothetical protein
VNCHVFNDLELPFVSFRNSVGGTDKIRNSKKDLHKTLPRQVNTTTKTRQGERRQDGTRQQKTRHHNTRQHKTEKTDKEEDEDSRFNIWRDWIGLLFITVYWLAMHENINFRKYQCIARSFDRASWLFSCIDRFNIWRDWIGLYWLALHENTIFRKYQWNARSKDKRNAWLATFDNLGWGSFALWSGSFHNLGSGSFENLGLASFVGSFENLGLGAYENFGLSLLRILAQ